jgi:hypothetical protein
LRFRTLRAGPSALAVVGKHSRQLFEIDDALSALQLAAIVVEAGDSGVGAGGQVVPKWYAEAA